MGEDAIPSIEIVLGLAVVVLGARTVALFQAAINVPEVHNRLVAALDSGNTKLIRLVRTLGFQSPYAEIAGSLIRVAQHVPEGDDRRAALRAKCVQAQALARRRFQRGQALDLVALALAVGLAAFARDGLPAGTLFWALGGALFTVLVLTLLARARLRSAINGSLQQLEENLARRPSVVPAPPSPPKPGTCPTCGQPLPHGTA